MQDSGDLKYFNMRVHFIESVCLIVSARVVSDNCSKIWLVYNGYNKAFMFGAVAIVSSNCFVMTGWMEICVKLILAGSLH